ncbi:MAG: SurA N-terminal domain-containing protein [Thermodesulfobacteriota bacterium]
MRNRILLTAILSFCLLLAGRAGAEEVVNRVVAVVGKEVITSLDLEKSIRQTKAQLASLQASQGAADLPPTQVRRLALERLIDDRLFAIEVARLNLKVSDAEVEHYINRIKRANNLSEEDFLASLTRQGLTFDEYKENLRKDILKHKLINHEVQKQVVISDAQVEAYFKKHQPEYGSLDQVEVRAIFFTVSPGAGVGADNLVRQKAENVLQQIKAGGDFAALAKQHSQGPGADRGGSLGKIKSSDLLPAMRQSLAELKPGQVSQVLQIPQGFVIMQLLSRSGKTDLPLTEVREQIRNKLEREALEQRFKDWMKELRAKAYVKILD